ncbi:MAG: hypothetical protein HYV14_05345 [Elusimicrobia bacterium]|nr:hypothetical protein [Elusimicrobiota bacterium]
MTIKPLLAAALIAASCLPLRAQDYDKKDVKKAEKLAAADKDFKSLPEDEKQEVILFIAKEIHGHRRKAIDADIRTLKGAKLEDLKKKARRNVVIAEQDKEAVSVPGTSRLDVKHIDTPPFGRLFKDNEWDVLGDSAEAQTLKQNIDKVSDVVKKGGGRLVSMHVESSASTLRNTGKAAKLTHLELSKLRAEAAARYALDYLKTKGFDLDEDEQVTLDYYGANKNGTSGASSPFAVPAGTDPKLVSEGSCQAPPDMKAAAAAGDLAKIAAFYDPNKFVQLTFDAVFEVKDDKPGKDIPGEAHVVTATVDYRDPVKIKLPRIRLPRIHIGWPFGNRDQRKARRQVRCPKW